ncbi:MAG: Spy/CpxP family protein refolding chaperone [Sulfuritalea sp.]|nr:Spy/CpxP family protein refolding chaperone [Sulfuritalea sp.]
MKRNSTIVAGILAASTVFFSFAYAQGPNSGSDGKPGFKNSSMQRGDRMDPGARIQQRLSRLKSALKLSDRQEPLWQAFAEKSASETGKGMQIMRERMQSDEQLSAPERMTQMQKLMQQRVNSMASVNESFNRLYSALTPEQKLAADKHFSSAGRHKHGAGRGGPRRDGQSAPEATESRKG